MVVLLKIKMTQINSTIMVRCNQSRPFFIGFRKYRGYASLTSLLEHPVELKPSETTSYSKTLEMEVISGQRETKWTSIAKRMD